MTNRANATAIVRKPMADTFGLLSVRSIIIVRRVLHALGLFLIIGNDNNCRIST